MRPASWGSPARPSDGGGSHEISRGQDPDTGARAPRDEWLGDAPHHDPSLRRGAGADRARVHRRHDDLERRRAAELVALRRRHRGHPLGRPPLPRVLRAAAHRGTAKQGGFCWGNPFYSNGPATQSTGQSIWTQAKNKSSDDSSQAQPKKLKRYKISLRARTLNGEKLKVNDKRGNPVDIAAVVVWRVEDTAKAVFDVDDFETYVATQSETAVRHLASAYPYDSGETFADTDDEITLRGNVDEVSEALRVELTERLEQAGVAVEQARLTHLAYAPEIAQAMLRRQQAA